MADEGLKTGKDKFKDADDRLLVGRLKVGISQKPFLCLFVFWFVLSTEWQIQIPNAVSTVIVIIDDGG